MLNDSYEITATSSNSNPPTYTFKSTGTNGTIEKVVQFSPIDNMPGVFNLGFGDYIDNQIDDTARSGNGDMNKVLHTVAFITSKFLETNPNATIIAAGSTMARTRLYQMNLNKYYSEICENFELWGLSKREKQWEAFELNKNYDAFVIRKKR